jgi:hypothetical protein
MFDEHIRRSAGRLGVAPIAFQHPLEEDVLSAFTSDDNRARVVVLTGTAGDGKSHLCGRVWQVLDGPAADWASDNVYFSLRAKRAQDTITLHVIRDLTALPEQDPEGRYESKAALLHLLSKALFEPGSDMFLLAANDGQLIETWRKLGSEGAAAKARNMFEARLMEDDDPEPGEALRFFNLSTVSSAKVLTLALNALLAHSGWEACYSDAEVEGFFSSRCPIRRNYELLREPLVQSRLQALFQLCDYNELHTPIRRVLMLLSNAILGHPSAKDRLLLPKDVQGLIAADDIHSASLFNNLFGANLGSTKRESLEIFDYLGRFGIGYETTNRIDNILIFGAEDENLQQYYEVLIANDTFYGATSRYRAAQHAYVEAPEVTNGDRHLFLDMLTAQRRGLFFKIPHEWEDELSLWKLTVFTGAGDYLNEVARPLIAKERVTRYVVTGLVSGLNRIFTGMLVSSERELLLATSLSFSSARVSQLLEDRIAVAARGRPEKVEVTLRRGFPHLDVYLPNGTVRSLRLNLTRYEFLMRVSEGALPGNFSRECYEDILSFKSALLAAAAHSRSPDDDETEELSFRLLSLDEAGNPVDEVVEVASV